MISLVFLIYIVHSGADIISPCGGDDWIAYKNDKCFKLVKQNGNGSQAGEICRQLLGSVTDFSITTLTSTEEREFLMKHVYNTSDSSSTENWVLCEKYQRSSIKQLQQAEWVELQDSIKRITNQLNTQSAQLNEANSKLETLQNNPVPVGFIYVQLPNQPEPYLLWDTVNWIDVTSEYAGLFFRVLGGGSQQFGVTQAANSPRLTHVNHLTMTGIRELVTISADDRFSDPITSGPVAPPGIPTTNYWGLRFSQSSDEVRPRNTAVRIWKRAE